MLEFLKSNYEWLFSGIGVAVVTLVITKLKRKPKGLSAATSREVEPTFISEEVQALLGGTNTEGIEEGTRPSKNQRILFIDDNHDEFKMVSILKKAGYARTKAAKDIIDLDDSRVTSSDIVFVDINGVGTTMFNDQGLGLAAAIKERHPDITVILYSAEPTGNRFDKKLRLVDDSLPKNAEPFEFISMIEEYS